MRINVCYFRSQFLCSVTKSKHPIKLLQLDQHKTECVENASRFSHGFAMPIAKSFEYFLFAQIHETVLFPILLACILFIYCEQSDELIQIKTDTLYNYLYNYMQLAACPGPD